MQLSDMPHLSMTQCQSIPKKKQATLLNLTWKVPFHSLQNSNKCRDKVIKKQLKQITKGFYAQLFINGIDAKFEC